jgi:hypothetical protein
VLVSPTLAMLLQRGAIGLVFVGLFGLGASYLLRKRPQAVPQAVIGRRARRSKPLLLALCSLAAMIGGAIGTRAVVAHTSDVVIVTDGVGGPVATRYAWLGDKGHYHATLAADEPHGSHAVWFDNQSSSTLTLEQIDYQLASVPKGVLFTEAPQPRSVAPHTIVTSPSVDFIGPQNAPPAQIESEGMASTQVWLRW